VHVGAGEYSEVYHFSHQMTETTTKFVKLSTQGETLLLTEGHYVYINGALVQARNAKVGDKVTLADGSSAAIVEISAEWQQGLYAPHTLHGDVVVDGVLASTYTGTVHPTLAHAVMYPLRQLYAAGLKFDSDWSNKIHSVSPQWLYDALRSE